MTLNEIALLVTGLGGMAGFVLAYLARGQVIDRDGQLSRSHDELMDARGIAFGNGARAVVAETRMAELMTELAATRASLDSERKSKQALVDALTKAGVLVGDLLVDGALDRLYTDGGGQGADPGRGADRDSVPIELAPAASAASSSR